MGNVLFCPQLHQDGIDCVTGTGFVVMRHPPLLETFQLDKAGLKESSPVKKSGSQEVEVRSETKDLAYHGFDFRFTELTSEEVTKPSTGKTTIAHSDSSSNEFNFTTRLYHTKSNTMVTKDNFRKLRLHGKLLNDVLNCCQDIVQQELEDFYRYDVVTIPVSSSRKLGAGGDDATPPIRAYVSPDLAETLSKDSLTAPQHASIQEKPVLLIMCGKGKSRAGVLSTKQLLLSGVESGSAVHHILQAEEQKMSVILLDPNAWGESRGMDVVNHSLTYFFGGKTADPSEGPRASASAGLSNRPLFIVAHSAAGGYLTRYLSQGVARGTLLRQIHRVAFTDSTHNLQSFKRDQRLWDYLQSSKCLYIRNNSAPRPFGNHHGKQAGEKHEGDHWWHHRFGNIRTVWAGTPEHSLMCWTARHVIWEFFAEKDRIKAE